MLLVLTHSDAISIPYVHFNTLVLTAFISSPYSHAPLTTAILGRGGTVENER